MESKDLEIGGDVLFQAMYCPCIYLESLNGTTKAIHDS
jgi:hypothetical protein